MVILGIAGSPRKEGNSTSLLKMSLKGAEEREHNSEILYASDQAVQPCLGCNGCKSDPTCVVRDDMIHVYRKLEAADILVIATPIYFYSMSGWLKAIVDRMWALLEGENMNYVSRLSPGRKLYVITAQEESNPADGQSVVDIIARGLKWLGYKLEGSLVAVNVYNAKDYLQQPELHKRAFNLIK